MPYNGKEYKTTNVNYLNKDFNSFKTNLMQYAKTYFPNSYKDFNETSPGMMLMEMSAYVGDVLSFYLDQQFQEMMLPLAEERRNMINIAKMFGYKVKASVPSHTILTVTQQVGVTGDAMADDLSPNWSDTIIIDKGWNIKSATDDTISFETLDVVDFSTSSSVDTILPEPIGFDPDGVVTSYKLTRQVKALACETKTQTFTIGAPTQYKKLTLTDRNVIDIVSVEDLNNGNMWYEVDYLVQDKVPVSTHFTSDDRPTAYSYGGVEDGAHNVAVPYTLHYKKTGKRFITQINDDNSTSLIFGNGVLRNGAFAPDEFISSEDTGMTWAGQPDADSLDIPLDPMGGNSRMTLGETPSNTSFKVTYRVGGGIESNIASNILTSFDSPTCILGTHSGKNISVTNPNPTIGGAEKENVEELRHRIMAHFASQNRCVTKEDYEARILNMDARYGSIAKVFVDRVGVDVQGSSTNNLFTQNLDFDPDGEAELEPDGLVTPGDFTTFKTAINSSVGQQAYTTEATTMMDKMEKFFNDYNLLTNNIGEDTLATLDVYILAYDNNKVLATTPSTSVEEGSISHPLKTNIKKYLNNYRMVTDQLNIKDGKIINFGVAFDVVAHKTSNKADVKLRCIQKIIEYFNIDKMQFRQPIYTNELEYELMGLDGVRSVNWVQLTQNFNFLGGDASLPGIGDDTLLLYDYNFENTEGGATGNNAYGWFYDFAQFYEGETSTGGIIVPSKDPSVFELKYPKQNIRGVVR